MDVNEFLSKNLEMVKSGGHSYIPRKNREDISVEITISRKSGSPTITVEREGGRITIHSIFDPEKEAVKWVATRNLPSGLRKVLVYGVGMGYHIEALMDAFPGIHVDIVDATPEIFEAAAGARNLEKILGSSNVSLHVSPLDGAIVHLSELLEDYSGNAEEDSLLVHKPSVDALGSRDEFLRYHMEMTGLSKMLSQEGSVFNNNVEKNVDMNRDLDSSSIKVEELFDTFRSKPVIVAATGPSLDISIATMLDFDVIPPIIAVDSALKPLVNAGIKPDFVVTGDPQEEVAILFENVDLSDVKLVFFDSSFHGVPLMFSKENRIVSKRVSINDNENKGLFFSGTILTAALDFAVKCGANPVILIGADFSFAKGKTHASGFHSQKIMPRYGRTMEATGLDGNKVTTSQIFNMFRNDINQYCKRKSGMTNILNATARGLPIENTPEISLNEFLEKYAKEVDT